MALNMPYVVQMGPKAFNVRINSTISSEHSMGFPKRDLNAPQAACICSQQPMQPFHTELHSLGMPLTFTSVIKRVRLAV